ncbi:unnamed protein product [Vicia faba]|uniref:Reverse transcriptase Ty1/copia-type domain-containing protein n=1 Tax=Vicia faba TaxID=3906 RepID=A0AAV1B4F6_VICFA|nr:unnamed protein product [Vicia faba]
MQSSSTLPTEHTYADPELSHQYPSSTDVSGFLDNNNSSPSLQQQSATPSSDSDHSGTNAEPIPFRQPNNHSAPILPVTDPPAAGPNPTDNPGSPLSIESYDSLSSHNPINHSPSNHFQENQDNHIRPSNLPFRQSSRISNPPTYLADYHCYHANNNQNTSHFPFIQTQTTYPLSSVIFYHKCSPSYKKYCCNISSISEPTTYKQAIKHDCWINAMDVELKALAENQTWVVVDLPSGKVPIGRHWVYKVKYKANGSIECYKARLVAKRLHSNGGN